MRMLRDSTQGMVLVYELDPAAGVKEQRSLVFETGSWCARVAAFPADWRRLRDEELLGLGSLRR